MGQETFRPEDIVGGTGLVCGNIKFDILATCRFGMLLHKAQAYTRVKSRGTAGLIILLTDCIGLVFLNSKK